MNRSDLYVTYINSVYNHSLADINHTELLQGTNIRDTSNRLIHIHPNWVYVVCNLQLIHMQYKLK